MTHPVLKLVSADIPTARLRQRFKGSIRADRQQMSSQFARRVVGAVATGGLAYAALRKGLPFAAKRLGAFEESQKAGLGRLGRSVAIRNAPVLHRLFGAAKTARKTEALAHRGRGLAAVQLGHEAIGGATAHTGKIAVGLGGAHLIGGSIHHARKTRREQNKLARRLLTL